MPTHNKPYTISLETKPSAQDLRTIQNGLRDHNLLHAPPDGFAPLTLLVRADDGTLLGGLLGATYWGWLHVDILWLHESARRQGLGRQLLMAAEKQAVERGCRFAHLDTMSFQALDFYERQGYTVFGTLDDLPAGHQRHFMKKDLPGAPRYPIRPLTQADEPLLWEMLYHAMYVPPGDAPSLRETVNRPELARYVRGWGRADDRGFVALDGHQPIGAAWLRLLVGDDGGYGHVDDATPELSIAVLSEYRGRGIGTRLLTRLLQLASEHYAAVSLSVAQNNPALRLYGRLGFDIVGTSGVSLTMRKALGGVCALRALVTRAS